MTPNEHQWYGNPEVYRVLMDGRWDLEDLYAMPHAFGQCYAFIYCFDAATNPLDQDRITSTLRRLPWRGGFSYLNIYGVLSANVQWEHRPRVSEIRYASPGWIEIYLSLDVALHVAKAIAALAGAGAVAVKSYTAASKSDLKLLREKNRVAELKLAKEHHQALLAICDSHAKLLGFKSVTKLVELTGNPEVTLRLLLAHHRRLEDLAKLSEDGKATFPTEREA